MPVPSSSPAPVPARKFDHVHRYAQRPREAGEHCLLWSLDPPLLQVGDGEHVHACLCRELLLSHARLLSEVPERH